MRWLILYVRSRQVPVAIAGAAAGLTGTWLLHLLFDGGPAGGTTVVLTVLLLVAALTATLGGPDETLERTASLRGAPRRLGHLLLALAVVVGLVSITRSTGAEFGPLGLVLRDAAGLLGLTASGAPLLGSGRAWFVPLAWTLVAAVYPATGSVLGEVLTWQGQAPDNGPAAVTAAVLGVTGLVAYAAVGSAPRPPAEAAL